MTMRLLNFGCGTRQPDPPWVNLDRQPYGQEHLADAAVDLLPFPDGHFDGVLASRSLQENDYSALPPVLGELRRVLCRGGTIRVLWPDVAAAVAAWSRGDRSWFPVNDAEPTVDDAFCCYLNWFGTARTLCTLPRLVTLLERASFQDPHPMPFRTSALTYLADLDDRLPEEQLIVEATAP